MNATLVKFDKVLAIMVQPRRVQRMYGRRAVESERELIKLEVKLAKLKNRKLFLLNCRRLKISPQFLNFVFHLNVENEQSAIELDKAVRNFKQKVLSVLISDTMRSVKRNRERANQQHDLLDRMLGEADFTMLTQKAARKGNRVFALCKQRQIQKLEKLKSSKADMSSSKNWVLNCTNEPLPDYLTRSLQLGSGFNNPNPHDAPYVRILSEI